MLTLNTAFESELKKRIAEEIERLRDKLEHQASDAVSRTQGEISSLRRVADNYCSEVSDLIAKR